MDATPTKFVFHPGPPPRPRLPRRWTGAIVAAAATVMLGWSLLAAWPRPTVMSAILRSPEEPSATAAALANRPVQDIARELVSRENIGRTLRALFAGGGDWERRDLTAEVDAWSQRLRTGVDRLGTPRIELTCAGPESRLVEEFLTEHVRRFLEELNAPTVDAAARTRVQDSVAAEQALAAADRKFSAALASVFALPTQARTPPPTATPAGPGEPNPRWVELTQQLQDLHELRAQLLETMTDAHPRVRELDERLAAVERSVAETPSASETPAAPPVAPAAEPATISAAEAARLNDAAAREWAELSARQTEFQALAAANRDAATAAAWSRPPMWTCELFSDVTPPRRMTPGQWLALLAAGTMAGWFTRRRMRVISPPIPLAAIAPPPHIAPAFRTVDEVRRRVHAPVVGVLSTRRAA